MTTQNQKEIVTSMGHKLVLNNYITYGQHRELTEIYLSKKEDIEISKEADKRAVEMVIVSIDGVSENIYELFSALPFNDVSEVLKIIKSTVNPKD